MTNQPAGVDIQLQDDDIRQLEDWKGLLSYKVNPGANVLKWVLHSPCMITCLFTGNQFGKNRTIATDYVMRILGTHPNKDKVVKPDDPIRTFRFASETLPSEGRSGEGDGEVKNTQYPAFTDILPKEFLLKDITTRNPVQTIRSPLGGKNIRVEYVSFGQETQAQAGVQRRSIWVDESSGKGFFEEQIPRLLASNGDLMYSYTPVPGNIGWEFDELFERARYVRRTETIRNRLLLRQGAVVPEIEVREDGADIMVIMAATDDNPTLTTDIIDAKYEMYDDEDVIDARRYGIFRQLSGRIYKSFSPSVHRVPDFTVPIGWKIFRGIDYHQSNPWACVWLTVSPHNEAFVFQEWYVDPSRYTTYDISFNVASMTGSHKSRLNLVDPLASTKQINTGLSTVDDLNRYFHHLRKEGHGTGGFWETWETQGTRGREEVTLRLLNSIKVGKPFNNRVVDRGTPVTLPTIWFFESCRHTLDAMKNWRRDEWGSRETIMRKEEKETPIQRWSHFPVAIECLFKRPEVSMAKYAISPQRPRKPKKYFSRVR